ncbi:hypothetical protein AFK68_00255 [Hydrocoleum sp. CS-953]|nr:hypothetical protein AFK68_00255 [Hydrocoleum sp. CS-953]
MYYKSPQIGNKSTFYPNFVETFYGKSLRYFLQKKLRYKVSPFMEKKAVEGWRGLLAISNQPREEKKSLSTNPSITEEVINN